MTSTKKEWDKPVEQARALTDAEVIALLSSHNSEDRTRAMDRLFGMRSDSGAYLVVTNRKGREIATTTEACSSKADAHVLFSVFLSITQRLGAQLGIALVFVPVQQQPDPNALVIAR